MAAAHHVPVLAQLPMDPSLAADCDAGRLEEHQPNDLVDAAAYLDGQLSSAR